MKELTNREDETGERARALLARVHRHATSITPPEGMRAEFRSIMSKSGARDVDELLGRAASKNGDSTELSQDNPSGNDPETGRER